MFNNNYLNLESVTISFSPFRFQVVALTTTHGNVNEPQVFNNSQKILNVIGRKDVCITNDIVFFITNTTQNHKYGFQPEFKYQISFIFEFRATIEFVR